MITIDSDPYLNPIYIGATILSEIKTSQYTQLPLNQLYEAARKRLNISYEVFAVSLDWLYVTGAIEISNDGKIEYAIKQT